MAAGIIDSERMEGSWSLRVNAFTFSRTAPELGMSADVITSIKLYEKGMRMLCVMYDLEICFLNAFLKIMEADETRCHENSLRYMYHLEGSAHRESLQ